jgi:hypothetical protein
MGIMVCLYWLIENCNYKYRKLNIINRNEEHKIAKIKFPHGDPRTTYKILLMREKQQYFRKIRNEIQE